MSNQKIPKIVNKVLPAVVSITVSKNLEFTKSPFGPGWGLEPFFGPLPKKKKKVKIGGGSGFIVDQSGIILTNRHVVAEKKAEYIALLDDDRKLKAKVLARDPINDIAVLKVDQEDLPTVELGDSSKLELGETVIAIGNALGRFSNTVSTGVVSGLSRKIKAISALERKTQRLKDLIQTDAAINPGNSGGPLVNLDGKAIGINAAMVHGAENIGFALPVNSAKKDLEEVKEYGRIRQPFLGVRYIPLNEKLQKRYDLPVDHGALVISEGPMGKAIVPGSPADEAGIKEGDIILECNQKKITSKNSLMEILHQFKVKQTIDVKLVREGKKMKVKLTLGERK